VNYAYGSQQDFSRRRVGPNGEGATKIGDFSSGHLPGHAPGSRMCKSRGPPQIDDTVDQLRNLAHECAVERFKEALVNGKMALA
jgi:hypothetical protein